MYIDKFKKIVIKVGSSILIDEQGKPKKVWLKEFAKDIQNFIRKKKQIVIVSSGAIAMGCDPVAQWRDGTRGRDAHRGIRGFLFSSLHDGLRPDGQGAKATDPSHG